MARIVFTQIGSRDDLYPIPTFAKELRAPGHDHLFIPFASLAGAVRSEGFGSIPVRKPAASNGLPRWVS